MKRLGKTPDDPMPEVYLKSESNKEETATPTETEIKSVPPSTVYNYNLKKMSSFKQIRRKYKMSNQQSLFVHDLKLVLNEYKPVDNDLNSDLLIHTLNIAEQFFIYGSKDERETMKHEAVKSIMMPYFRGDEVLLDKFIIQVWPKVRKSNIAKRMWSRLKLFLKL